MISSAKLFVASLAAAVTSVLAFPPSTAANSTFHLQRGSGRSGESIAAPGKELVQISCDGLGMVTVAVQRGENANGAGQFVDLKGHGIPVENTFTLTDLTTSTVLATEVTTTGQNSHSNQPATHCSGVLLEASASDFFGSDLPPGVAATDTVQLALEALVILKL